MDTASAVLGEGLDLTKPRIYGVRLKSGNVALTRLRYGAHGQSSRRQKEKRQQ